MRYQMIVLICHALIFSPGCRNRTNNSTAKEDQGERQTVTNESLDAYAKEVGLYTQNHKILSFVKEKHRNVLVFGESPETGQLVPIKTEQFADFDLSNPLSDPVSGASYEWFYLQKRQSPSREILGIQIIGKNNSKRLGIAFKSLRLPSSIAINLKNVKGSDLRTNPTGGAFLAFDNKQRTPTEFQSFIERQALSLKSFFTKWMSTETSSKGAMNLRGPSSGLSGGELTFAIFAAIAVIAFIFVVIASFIPYFEGSKVLVEALGPATEGFVICIAFAAVGYVIGLGVDKLNTGKALKR